MEIRTPRLLLRQFRESDIDGLAAMGQDPVVMKYFMAKLTREECIAMYERMKARWEESGFGVFAVEIPGEADFAGFVGLTIPRFEAAFTPCTEILWRMMPAYHNKGYCTEAARAVLDWAFHTKGMTEILAWAVPQNIPSWRVMEKVGMQRIGDFDHPMVPADHALCKHLLYRMQSPVLTNV